MKFACSKIIIRGLIVIVFPGLVAVCGQTDSGGRRGHRLGGVARVRRRNGQRPHTRQAGPSGAAVLRRWPVVRLHCRLATRRLHEAGRDHGLRIGCIRRTVPVLAGVAVLPDAERQNG